MRFDFHVHYKRHARDETGFEDAMCQAAVAAKLNGICFTEHHQRLPDDRCAELRTLHPALMIWSGVEVSCEEDLLVYGVDDPILHGRSKASIVGPLVTERGGLIVIAHPFRRRSYIDPAVLAMHRHVYGIEVSSRNTPPSAVMVISASAKQYCWKMFCSSDAHKPRHIGPHYTVGPDLLSGSSVIQALKWSY